MKKSAQCSDAAISTPPDEMLDTGLQHAMWGTSFRDNPVDQSPNETQQIGEFAETPPNSVQNCPSCGFDCDRISEFSPSQPCPKCGFSKVAARIKKILNILK